MDNKKAKTIAILTLGRHKDGVWIHKLVQCLLDKNIREKSGNRVEVQVVVLEDFLAAPVLVSEPNDTMSQWTAIVNRVSDAAEPWEVKACMSLLQIAKQVWKIPIFNGPDAYSVCTNKWCHHVLFAQAGLTSPTTIAMMKQKNETDKHQFQKSLKELQRHSSQTPKQNHNDNDNDKEALDYLIKPNAGGFGSGIVRKSLAREEIETNKQTSSNDNLPDYSDQMVLLQEYTSPKQQRIYRVWFLLGKAQSAVERDISKDGSEFTSGCVGGACTIRRAYEQKNDDGTTEKQPMISIWEVPADVREEIENKLLPSLPADAHCGSVEFLYNDCEDDDEAQRLYFDINLLSTLPLLDSNGNSSDKPWLELAKAIFEICL